MLHLYGETLAFLDIGVFFEFTKGTLSGMHLVINALTSIMLVISVIATIFSGIDYIKDGKDLLKDC